VVRDHVHGLCDGFGFARGSSCGDGRVGDLQYDEAGRDEAGDNAGDDSSTCDAVAKPDGTVFFGSGNAAATAVDAAATDSGAAKPQEVAFLFDSVAGDTRRS